MRGVVSHIKKSKLDKKWFWSVKIDLISGSVHNIQSFLVPVHQERIVYLLVIYSNYYLRDWLKAEATLSRRGLTIFTKSRFHHAYQAINTSLIY